MSILLRNAQVVDLQSPHHNKRVNILIEDNQISSMNGSDAEKEIDCTDKLVLPGLCDLNADFCDPGYEFKEDLTTGSFAAMAGGFTDVNLIPSTEPPIQTKSDVEYILSKTTKYLDLHVSGALTKMLDGKELSEIIDLKKSGARSFSDGLNPVWNTELLLKSLQYTSQVDVPIFQNARDSYLSRNTHMHESVISTELGLRGEPSISESIAIERDLNILKYAGGKLHFSALSSLDAVNLIREAKSSGLAVTCDVGIHHLMFIDEDLLSFDSNLKSLPPYRSKSDRVALIEGVLDGTIDAICSYHRPQDQESKQLEFDLAENGAIAIQTFISSLLSISDVPFELLIERVTKGARKILGLDEIVVDAGNVAKLAIVDPKAEWELNNDTNLSKSRNSPFWNQLLKGRVVATINKGNLHYSNG